MMGIESGPSGSRDMPTIQRNASNFKNKREELNFHIRWRGRFFLLTEKNRNKQKKENRGVLSFVCIHVWVLSACSFTRDICKLFCKFVRNLIANERYNRYYTFGRTDRQADEQFDMLSHIPGLKIAKNILYMFNIFLFISFAMQWWA